MKEDKNLFYTLKEKFNTYKNEKPEDFDSPENKEKRRKIRLKIRTKILVPTIFIKSKACLEILTSFFI